MTSSPVLVESLDDVTRITINRPQARNALNRETINLLTRAFNEIASGQRVVVLTGAGREAFCAGADITELISQTTAEGRRAFFQGVGDLIEAMHRCRQPIVGKVYGYALAGGCGLAAACDISIAAEGAHFALPEVALGLAPMVVMAPIHRAIGRRALSELALVGDRISAARAQQIGLINRVVPDTEVENECDAVVTRLCKMSPDALVATKKAIFDVSENEYSPFLLELADRSALLSLGNEAQEGLASFIEKRKPSWSKSETKKRS